MKNFVQSGKTITVPVVDSNGVQSGDLVVIRSLAGVAAANAAADEEVEIDVEGVFELPKVAADEIAVGELLYHDGEAKLTNDGSGALLQVGVAVRAAAASTTTVYCRLMQTGAVGSA